ncbi:MAG TPA: nicotinate-nucleotide--dimethylbenzimidazole phosphoribosyltransferase, partial [Candidatus Acidoferrales bacterium]|nr:nicotinate-nucleotide--dimethylbenzimidazole phosphoribosyltransferase [Candidatus Acidoferrales bacterium]
HINLMSLLDDIAKQIRPLDNEAAWAADARLNSLTKPPGSLGRLEELVRRYAAIRRDGAARMGRGAIAVFVADHGVAAEGVSAFPQSVTVEMLRNIAGGGAAISVLARRFGYALSVVDVGVKTDTSENPLAGVTYRRVGAGTRNLASEPAMSRDETMRALEVGIEVARELARSDATLIGIGEMGIANSTPAAAILSAVTGIEPAAMVGRGTGLDDAGVRRKIEVVTRALELHRRTRASGRPLEMLAALGGFEIAAMAGVCLGGAALDVPVVVDGFIATAAAAAAEKIHPGILEHLFFSHRSAEGGHALVLEHLKVRPILDLDLRLGEGTGAALAMNVIEAALDLFHGMATFAGAGVSGKLR